MLPPSRIMAIAFGLLLVVLSHDAIMAADPHAPGREPGPAHGVHDGHAEPMAHETHLPSDAHVETDDSPCAPGAEARLTDSNDFEPATSASPLPILVPLAQVRDGGSPPWWREPVTPPDVLRAMTQVYLN